MLKPTGITEAALYVGNLDRAIQFYTDLFNCPMIRRDDRFCALRIAEEQVLLLFLRGHSLQPISLEKGFIPAHDGAGPLHICFGIAATQVNNWENRLAQFGIPIESRVTWPGGAVSLYFRDPDDHAVELATPGLWR